LPDDFTRCRLRDRANPDADRNADWAYTHAYPDADVDTYRAADDDSYVDTYRNADGAKSHANRDNYVYAHANAYTNAHPGPDHVHHAVDDQERDDSRRDVLV
jgi:hypothetical protein